MFTLKEIEHPLSNIRLMADETIAVSETENKLLKSFVKIHDQLYKFEQDIKEYNDFFNEHHHNFLKVKLEFESFEDRMHQFPETKLKLQTHQASYKSFHDQYVAFVEEVEKYEIVYHEFYPEFEKMNKESGKLNQMFDKLCESGDDIDTTIEVIDTLETEVIGNTESKAMDWYHFDNEYQIFLGRIDKSTEEFNKIDFALNDYISEEFNPLADRYNTGFDKMKKFYNTIDKLHAAYLLYTKAKEAGSWLIFMEWKDQNDLKNKDDFVNYGITYDMEYSPKGVLILHLDLYLSIECLLNCAVRNSFRMKCTLEEAFTKEVMEPLIGHCIEMTKGEIFRSVKKDNRQFDIETIITSYHITEHLAKSFVEGETSQADFGIINDDSFKIAVTVTSPRQIQLIGVTSLNIMDQLFFLNKKFDNRKMRDAFNRVLSLSHYLTLENLLPQISKGPINLNSRQYLMLLTLLDCASQLLLGDHDVDFLEGLEKAGIRASHRKEFLKAAQASIKAGRESLTKPDSDASPLDIFPDWNHIFFEG